MVEQAFFHYALILIGVFISNQKSFQMVYKHGGSIPIYLQEKIAREQTTKTYQHLVKESGFVVLVMELVLET